ncbi:hypothetical protein [Mobilicoccus pelagius]|uniref:hypothetical protein n=1 Tax=Mobilicoccus pelagius TaxID=746032 RepID=UPI00145FC9C1|nr:hypothetical protein [Mobilicoccus pelagius]
MTRASSPLSRAAEYLGLARPAPRPNTARSVFRLALLVVVVVALVVGPLTRARARRAA